MIAFKCFCPKYSVIIQDLVAYNLKATVMHEVVSESRTCYFNFGTCGFFSASVLSINIVIMWYLNSYTKESGHELTEKTKGFYSRTNQHLRFPGLQIIAVFFHVFRTMAFHFVLKRLFRVQPQEGLIKFWCCRSCCVKTSILFSIFTPVSHHCCPNHINDPARS